MATRKQRRRREKNFRHEYGFVVQDEEGKEVELAGSELRAQKGMPERAKAAPSTAKGTGKGKGKERVVRDPEPPTWRRAFRRGLIWTGPIIAGCVVFLRSNPLPIRIVFGVAYSALFIPFTYWLDRWVYRRFERKQALRPTGKGR